MKTASNHHSKQGARSCGHTFLFMKEWLFNTTGYHQTDSRTSWCQLLLLLCAQQLDLALTPPTATNSRPQGNPSNHPQSHQHHQCRAADHTRCANRHSKAPATPTQRRQHSRVLLLLACRLLPFTVTHCSRQLIDHPLLRPSGAQGRWGRQGRLRPRRTPPRQLLPRRRLERRPRGPQARCRRAR